MSDDVQALASQKRTGILFVGPILKRIGPNRTMEFVVIAMHPGSSIIELKYTRMSEAAWARNQLTALPNTHQVPSKKLMEAIWETMQQMWHLPPPVTVKPVV